MEALAQKYQHVVRFVVVYGYETHPENPGDIGRFLAHGEPITAARTVEDRWGFAVNFRAAYRVQRQVLVDEFDGKSAAQHLLGETRYTHPLVVLDLKGNIAYRTEWAVAEHLEHSLQVLLGAGEGQVLP
jgi:hypothetical protein